MIVVSNMSMRRTNEIFRRDLDEIDDYVKEYEQMGMEQQIISNQHNSHQQLDENMRSPGVMSENGKSLEL